MVNHFPIVGRIKLIDFICYSFFYKDYFVCKLINKLMRKGKKAVALSVIKHSFFLLKRKLGFQPFFYFKHIIFQMRQLFKVQKTVLRQVNVTYFPLLLKPSNQLNYGINHIVKGADQLVRDEKLKISDAISIILLNCFVYTWE